MALASSSRLLRMIFLPGYLAGYILAHGLQFGCLGGGASDVVGQEDLTVFELPALYCL